MAWPKGVKRGKDGKKADPEPVQPEREVRITDAESEPIPARYDPDAVPLERQPTVPSGEVTPKDAVRYLAAASEGRQKAKRRRRQGKTGVKVGKTFYGATSGTWEANGRYLRLRAEGREIWVPVDGKAAIEVKGFNLPTFPQPGSVYGSFSNVSATNANDSTIWFDSGHGYSTAGASGTTGPRVVEPTQHVNVQPGREDYLRAHRMAQNAELESAMGAEP